jgi:hypothetical protein
MSDRLYIEKNTALTRRFHDVYFVFLLKSDNQIQVWLYHTKVADKKVISLQTSSNEFV